MILEQYKRSDKIPRQCLCSDGTDGILKGWGCEEFVFHSIDELEAQDIKVETVKLLHFKKGKRLSMHQHLDKSEYFFILDGKFFIEILDLSTQTLHEFIMEKGERIFVPRGLFHRMLCDEQGTILEVSTLDAPHDSYRLIKGD